jgi:hypothetical protein
MPVFLNVILPRWVGNRYQRRCIERTTSGLLVGLHEGGTTVIYR